MSAAGGKYPSTVHVVFFVCALCTIISETMQRYKIYDNEDNRGLEI